jgi:hypothetical protein
VSIATSVVKSAGPVGGSPLPSPLRRHHLSAAITVTAAAAATVSITSSSSVSISATAATVVIAAITAVTVVIAAATAITAAAAVIAATAVIAVAITAAAAVIAATAVIAVTITAAAKNFFFSSPARSGPEPKTRDSTWVGGGDGHNTRTHSVAEYLHSGRSVRFGFGSAKNCATRRRKWAASGAALREAMMAVMVVMVKMATATAAAAS